MSGPFVTDFTPFYSYALLTAVSLFVALLDAFRRRRSTAPLGWVTAAGAVAAIVLDDRAGTGPQFAGLVRFDAFSRAFDAVFLASLAVVAVGSTSEERRMRFAGEYYALLLLSTVGLMFMASAGGLLMLYVGLELTTLCLFALVGFAKREQRSAEAALKMLVVGAVASAVILYGVSILYGLLGSTQYAAIAQGVRGMGGQYPAVLWLGLAFIMGGLGFKIAVVPFHLWAPDVYEGAPATVSAYLSTASKAGGFAALLRFLLVALGSAADYWLTFVVVLSVLSMVVGNLVGIHQTNLKRLLAYSGIAQAGYILVAVAGTAHGDAGFGVSSALMYLMLYAFTNVGGFMVAQAIQNATGSDDIAALRGLHKRSAPLAFAMLVILFSLGGIPPLAGFVGKLYLFAAGWQGGQRMLVIVGALTSVVSLYYYLMVALQVYIRDPEDDRRMGVSAPVGLAIAVCVFFTVAIGVYPQPWIALGQGAGGAGSSAPPVQIDRASAGLVISGPNAPGRVSARR